VARPHGLGPVQTLLAEAGSEALRPLQERYGAIRADPSALEAVLRDGRERASAVLGGDAGAGAQGAGFSGSALKRLALER